MHLETKSRSTTSISFTSFINKRSTRSWWFTLNFMIKNKNNSLGKTGRKSVSQK